MALYSRPQVKAPEFPFWRISLAEVFATLQCGVEGLTTLEAGLRLVTNGPNELDKSTHYHVLWQWLRKLRSPLVLLLLAACFVSAGAGDFASSAIIAAIILVSVTLDFVQEYRANVTAERLQACTALRTSTLRDGEVAHLPHAELVPGDIIILGAGDLIPADCRLLQADDLFVDQELHSGESFPVEKGIDDAANDALFSATNCIMRGSTVITGRAHAIICRTGMATELGTVARSLARPPDVSSFERGLQNFGAMILRVTALLILSVMLINAYLARPLLESFMFALALAVGLTPELLPMVVSVTLARGAQRLAGTQVLVKRLAAISDFGSMDILCTDKTGTLTEAAIQLERHVDSEGCDSECVPELVYYNSFFETGVRSPLDEAIVRHREIRHEGWCKIDEIPFDFERRRVSVLIDDGTQRLLIVKGAPEEILRLSDRYESRGIATLDHAARARIGLFHESLGSEGFRVLGVAVRQMPRDHTVAVASDESGMVFTGFAAFLDPPKKSARAALEALGKDHVDVKILTGDSENVTLHLCAQLGIRSPVVLSGSQIGTMTEAALAVAAERTQLFCRVSPIQKQAVIRALQARGKVVGYLGDGINDAPALQSADVGISVDSAADVAKAAADVILMKQDLGVLHLGIIEGRRTFANIMKYIMMGTSSNFGNMFSMAGAALVLPFLPMLPIQILLNNLLYDVSELPIPFDTVDRGELSHPQHWDLGVVRNFMMLIGPVSSAFDFVVFFILARVFSANEAQFHTGWFIESIASQILVIFIVRTRARPWRSKAHPLLVGCALITIVCAAGLPYTPAGRLFGFVPLPGAILVALSLVTALYLAAAETAKHFFFRTYATPTGSGLYAQ